MILFFADIHLGIKSHSIRHDDGLYTSERDAIKSLEAIYDRSQMGDIDTIICGGDITHTNNPTTEVIAYLTDWLYKMDDIGKPFYIITGNHDVSMFSNSLKYTKKLRLENTVFIDSYDATHFIKWNDWSLVFVPYETDLSLKTKEQTFHNNLTDAIAQNRGNKMVVTHFQEQSCKIGSESTMIYKGVDVVDLENADMNIIVLSGHIHKSQVYTKNNITVAYPGSTTRMDAGDLNQEKGYLLVDSNGAITFEKIMGIRNYVKYVVTGESVLDFLSSKRIPMNSVIFIEHDNDVIDNIGIYSLIKKSDSFVGWIKKLRTEPSEGKVALDNLNALDPFTLTKDYIEEYCKVNKMSQELCNDAINFSIKKLEGFLNVN